jgi:hypothetical protein
MSPFVVLLPLALICSCLGFLAVLGVVCWLLIAQPWRKRELRGFEPLFPTEKNNLE